MVTGTGGQTAPVPVVTFARTSAATMDVTTPFATVTGSGWIDVDLIRLAGSPEPLTVTWITQNAWSLQLPLLIGPNLYTLEAVRKDGTIAGTTTVTVTTTSGTSPASADNVVISKIHYNPSAPTPAEIAAGFRMGRFVKWTNAYHNDLLVSIINGYGGNLTTYGEAAFCRGPLANLT